MRSSTGATVARVRARFFITPGGPGFRLNYGNSDQNQPNVFAGSVVYNLPFGHGQHFGNDVSGAMNQVIGGWQLNSIVIMNGGTPFDINTSGIGNIDNRADVISYSRVSRSTGWRKQQLEQQDLLHGNIWRAFAGDDLRWKHLLPEVR